MLYKNTQHNLFMLMHDIGYAYQEQLFRFFSDVDDAKNIPYYIKKQIDDRNFFWASSAFGKPMDTSSIPTSGSGRLPFMATHTNILMFRKTPEINVEALQRRLRSLWILASFKSKEVRQIYLATYPSQIMFITEDNQCYDVTVCNDFTIAQVAMMNREKGIPKGMQDEVNHIVLVPSAEFGEQLGPYGFDSYCFLDANNIPQYGVWE